MIPAWTSRRRVSRELARLDPWVTEPFALYEDADEASQAAAQEALERLGYSFRVPSLEDAIRRAMGPSR